MEILQTGVLEYWHWWVLGISLIILEIMVPGAFLLWLGIAAGITGLFVLIVPDMSWQIQALLFAVFSIISAIAGRAVYQRMQDRNNDGQPRLNRRGEQYIGRTFNLHTAIDNGIGTIRVDDTMWKVRGTDCPVGTKVRVLGIDGVIFNVETTE